MDNLQQELKNLKSDIIGSSKSERDVLERRIREIKSQAAEGGPVVETEPIEPIQVGDIDATDAAEHLADEFAVDLRIVVGTGKDGRITLQDVRNFLK